VDQEPAILQQMQRALLETLSQFQAPLGRLELQGLD
jgi:hypothetical protein